MQNSVSGIHDVQKVNRLSVSVHLAWRIFCHCMSNWCSAYRFNFEICPFELHLSVSRHIHHNDFQIDLFSTYWNVCGCMGSCIMHVIQQNKAFNLFFLNEKSKKKNNVWNSSQASTNILLMLWFMNYLVNLNKCLSEVFQTECIAYSGMLLRTYMHRWLISLSLVLHLNIKKNMYTNIYVNEEFTRRHNVHVI